MQQLLVSKSKPLTGTIPISGSKNGTLPLLAAAMLVEGETILENVPAIHDVDTMLQMLRAVGIKCTFIEPGVLKIDATHIHSCQAPYHLVRQMRGSFYVAGPLLGRLGEARVPLPGGCVIGSRPVDFHVSGFKALGAEVDETYGIMRTQARRGLHGGRVYLDPRWRSVGATVNVMLAATLAKGTTTIENASCEPEVVACGQFLKQCGAQIEGIGSSMLIVRGVEKLEETRFASIPDRMEAGTFMYATAIAGGDVLLKRVRPDHLVMVIDRLREAGVRVETDGDQLRIIASSDRPRSVDITTAPYPGFPTDLQPAHGALVARAVGTSVVEETIFDARYNYTDELARMGADIRITGQLAIIKGVPELTGAPVEANDVRAAAALVLAALCAEGQTAIDGAEFLDRGYENFEAKLRAIGAPLVRRDSNNSKELLCLA